MELSENDQISYPQDNLFRGQNHPEESPKMGTKFNKKVAEIHTRGRPKIYQTVAEKKRAYRERKKQSLKVMTPPLPKNKYRVLYADPPWKYSSDGLRKYGHALFHYPCMSIQALCDLRIRSITEDRAVLFIWVTSPMLEDSFKVIRAWGFEYKTSIIWDKMSHNYGHYVAMQHELLLICTKGSCKPDVGDLIHSVFSLSFKQDLGDIAHSVFSVKRNKTHSEKPREFRELIDKLYLTGNRIELFARSKHEGWDSWGNEVSEGETDGNA